jgi:hypothetical protein
MAGSGVMDGEVIAIYEGKCNLRGVEVVMRHIPEESGLPLYLYSRYTHFKRMPDVQLGQQLHTLFSISMISSHIWLH